MLDRHHRAMDTNTAHMTFEITQSQHDTTINLRSMHISIESVAGITEVQSLMGELAYELNMAINLGEKNMRVDSTTRTRNDLSCPPFTYPKAIASQPPSQINKETN